MNYIGEQRKIEISVLQHLKFIHIYQVMAFSFNSPFETGLISFKGSLKKTRMALFQGDDCGFEEFNSLSLFTPGKYEPQEAVTPVVRKELSALFQDEDSGLGMENETDTVKDTQSDTTMIKPANRFRRPFKSLSETPPSHVSGRLSVKTKRPLFDDDKVDSAAKKQKTSPSQEHPKLRKTLSFGDQPHQTSDDIKAVVNELVEKDNLVSDGSGQLRLPTIQGKHNDLKNISHDTMAAILQGEYDDVIGNFRVIDCRYPYEYEGGHIKGAENIYTHDGIIDLLHRDDVTSDGSRPIIIFHCEFSSERGPKLCRYLRSKDREMNSDNYPFLNYPEVYLLYGGYKEFYYNHKELCDPTDYKPMLHSDHVDDLRHFRSKSKSWTAGEKRRNRSQRLRF